MSALSKEELREEFVGKRLSDTSYTIESPAAVLDLAKLETNCLRMLETVQNLKLGWRPHVKTHKTIELTRLQVGVREGSPVNLVVSTVLEAENLLPLLKEYQAAGRDVNVLYSFPLHPSCLRRLSSFSKEVGPGGLSIMVDHPQQLVYAEALFKSSGHPPLAFIKIDGGYHRAGVIPQSEEAKTLTEMILRCDRGGSIVFYGLYIHAGNSYDTRQDWQALNYLLEEFSTLGQAAKGLGLRPTERALTLSVGASPTATSLQHPSLLQAGLVTTFSDDPNQQTLRSLARQLETLQAQGHRLEVHAGVYPTLDLQQLATHARDQELLNSSEIAITILADVVSLYPGRGNNGTTEALINVGCLGLGREPCKDMGAQKGVHYNGWGIVMPWPEADTVNLAPGPGFPAVYEGWQVGKISQEHGILTWESEKSAEIPLKVGQRVRIWPNHSCIAGSGFDYYLIVDSRNEGSRDTVVDVWPRWRGW